MAANVIGTTQVALDGGNPDPIRIKESNLGNLVADGFKFAVNRTAAADGRAVADIAFSNGGGIRTSIPGPGNVNEKQHVRRAAVRQRDGHGAERHGRAAEDADGVGRLADARRGDGKFPQISGFRMNVSTNSAYPPQVQNGTTVTTPGSRVRDLWLVNADGSDGEQLVDQRRRDLAPGR